MSKAQKLRTTLFGAGKEGMPRVDAVKLLGSSGNLSNMIKRGEVTIEDRDGVSTVVLNPEYTPKRQRKEGKPRKASKRAKKPAGHKRAAKKSRQLRTIKDVARKHLQAQAAAADDALVRNLVLDNVIEAARALVTAVRSEVEGLEDNPTLLAAVEQQERATRIARAVEPACPF